MSDVDLTVEYDESGNKRVTGDNTELTIYYDNAGNKKVTGVSSSINSVNGQTGDVVLDGNNIYSDASEATPVTLNDALAGETQARQDTDSDLQTKINALAGLGGALPHKDFGASPAAGQPLPEAWQETLTEYACESIWGDGGTFTWDNTEPWNSTYVIDEVTHTAVEIFNSTWVRNDADNHKFVLTNTPNTNPQIFDWADVGIDAVAQFTDALAGVIKGDSTTFGKVKSNTDGTGSVNGLVNTGDGTKALMDDGSYKPVLPGAWKGMNNTKGTDINIGLLTNGSMVNFEFCHQTTNSGTYIKLFKCFGWFYGDASGTAPGRTACKVLGDNIPVYAYADADKMYHLWIENTTNSNFPSITINSLWFSVQSSGQYIAGILPAVTFPAEIPAYTMVQL